MVKKEDSKKNSSSKKKNTKPKVVKKAPNKKEESIKDFEGLEKAIYKLTDNFQELSTKISTLLNVFGESAKELSKTQKIVPPTVSAKIDSLLDQNKTITKGLNEVEENLKMPKKTDLEKDDKKDSTENFVPTRPKPLPRIE